MPLIVDENKLNSLLGRSSPQPSFGGNDYSALFKDLQTISEGATQDLSLEDALKASRAFKAAKGNLSRAETLKALGGNPQEALETTFSDEETSPSGIQKTLHAMDTPGAAVREKLFKFAGMPTYTEDRLYGSDFVRYLQKQFLGEDTDSFPQKAARGVGGFVVDVATDPFSYLTFGAGAGAKVGGKGLTKAGQKLFTKAASKAEKAGMAGKDAHFVGETIVKGADKAGEKVLKSHGSRFMGQKFAPDPFHHIGKAGGKGLDVLRKFSNPAQTEPLSKMQTIAGDIVDVVENAGRMFSTKFGLSKPYLAIRRGWSSEMGVARSEVEKGIQEIFSLPGGKFASVEERNAILRAVDDPDNFKLPPELEGMASKVRTKFDELGTRLQADDILDTTVDNYMTHIIGQNLPKRFRGRAREGGTLSTGIQEKNKQRYYKTFKDLFDAQPELKNLTEQDAAKALANYWSVAERAISTKRFLNKVKSLSDPSITQYGKKLRLELDDFVSGGTKIEGLPQNIVEDLKRLDSPWQFTSDNLFARGYRNLHKAFKTMVTVVNPAFHGRNFLSNKVLGGMNAGKEMLEPGLWGDVARVLGKGKSGKGMDALFGSGKGVVSKNGVTYSYDEVRDMAKNMGVLKPDWGKDVAGLVEIPKFRDKLNPVKLGGKVGGAIENEGRLTNFIAHLRSGLSPEDAAKAVDEALFDYADLTDFQRQVKWVIPFATFMFKNAALHGKTLVNNPGRIAAQLRSGGAIGETILGGETVKKEDLKALPEYYQEGLRVAREVDNGTAVEVLSGIGLPIEDIMDLPIFSLIEGDLGRAAQKTLGRVSPVFKLGPEILGNVDFFFGSPLEGKRKNKDGTVDMPYNKAYPIIKKMPKAIQEYLEFEEYERGGEKKYKVNPMQMKKLEAWALGITAFHPALKGAVFSRYYRDWGKLLDSSKNLDSRLLDFTSGVRVHELPEVGSLKSRAATGRAYQLQELLNQSIGNRKKQLNIPRGL